MLFDERDDLTFSTVADIKGRISQLAHTLEQRDPSKGLKGYNTNLVLADLLRLVNDQQRMIDQLVSERSCH